MLLNTESQITLYNKHIIADNEHVPIIWNRVKKWTDDDKFVLGPSSYKQLYKTRRVRSVLCHWDVTYNSERAIRILKKRNLSAHFCIDNDGTIIQLLDTNDIAYHAGVWPVNKFSIGIEISNAYYIKANKWYKTNLDKTRPEINDAECHGNILPPFLGFFNEQLAALKQLFISLHNYYDIPYECPVDENDNMITTVHHDSSKAIFEGFNNHYNVSKNKIDCAGLNLQKILQEIKNEN